MGNVNVCHACVGIPPVIASCLDSTYALGMAAGLEAISDAGIPLLEAQPDRYALSTHVQLVAVPLLSVQPLGSKVGPTESLISDKFAICITSVAFVEFIPPNTHN